MVKHLAILILCTVATIALTNDEYHEYKNVLRFPYGTNYKHMGKLHHSLERVWVVTKIKIPSIYDIPRFTLDVNQTCMPKTEHKFVKEQIIRQCLQLAPKLQNVMMQHNMIYEKLIYHLTTELYAQFPGMKESMFPTTKREKRGIVAILAGIVTIASEVVNAFVNHKKHRAIEKSIIAMQHEQNMITNRVKKMAQEFIMYGRYDLNNTESIIETLEEATYNISTLQTMIQDASNIADWTQGMGKDNAEKMLMMRNQIEEYYDNMSFRFIHLYEKLLESVETDRRAMNKLQKGYLPMEIFPANKLKDILEQIENTVLLTNPTYKLAIDNINHYYDMKLVTFQTSTVDHSLIITFPIFIKPIMIGDLTLYEIEETHVPIEDKTNKTDSYTKVTINKPYIAANKIEYIQLRTTEINNCKKISYQYYCEEMFVIRHKNHATCESVMYFFPEEPQLVKEECEFQYFLNKTVPPTILDGGNKIVLANFRDPKRLKCPNKKNNIKLPLGQYTMIKREHLCQCHIIADNITILSSFEACTPNNRTVRRRHMLYYTINLPFFTYLKDLGMVQDKIDSLKTKITHRQQTFDMELTPIIGQTQPKTLKELRKKFGEQKHYLTSIQNLTNTWVEEEFKEEFQEVTKGWYTPEIMIFTIAGAAVTCLITIAVIKILVTQNRMQHQIAGLLTTYTLVETIPRISALPPIMTTTEIPAKEVICSDPTLNWIFATITIVGIVVILYKQCRRCDFFLGYRFKSKCKIFLVIHNDRRYLPIHLVSMPCHAAAISCLNDLEECEITLERSSCWDSIRVKYRDFTIFMNGSPFQLPKYVTVPLKDRSKARNILDHSPKQEYIAIKQGKYWIEPRKYQDETEEGKTEKTTPIMNMDEN